MITTELLEKLMSNDHGITTLDFSYQNINDDDISRLCLALKKNTQVYSLFLNSTQITDVSAYKIMALLRQNNSIKRVELARNKKMTDQCISVFLEEFKERFYNENALSYLALNPHRNMQWIEEKHQISATEFLREYFEEFRPIVIRGAINNMPACKNWSPKYFFDKMGSKEVSLTKHDLQDTTVTNYLFRLHVTKMKMHEAITSIENPPPQSELNYQFYLQQESLDYFPEIQNDITLPEFSSGIEHNYERNLWFGQKGILSALHYDAHNNLFFQIYGKKQVLLYPPSESQYLFQYQPEPDKMFSRINMSKIYQTDIVDALSDIAQRATGYQILLHPGDMVFIPKGWWHEIRTGDTSSISVNYWFGSKNTQIPEIEHLIQSGLDKKEERLEPKIIMQCARRLIELKNPNYICNNRTILQLAITFNVLDVAKLIIDHPLTEPNTITYFFPFSALFLAVKFARQEILKLLLKHNDVDIHSSMDRVGYTPLTLASENGHLGIINCLINAGANPNQADSLGRTPLDLAILNQHSSCIYFLKQFDNAGLSMNIPFVDEF